MTDNIGFRITNDVTDSRTLLSTAYQSDSKTFLAGSSGTSDTMDVIFIILWNIKIHNQINIIHVDSAGCDIRGDQNRIISGTELLHNTGAELLLHIPMQRNRFDVVLIQLITQFIYHFLRITENHAQIRIVMRQQHT